MNHNDHGSVTHLAWTAQPPSVQTRCLRAMSADAVHETKSGGEGIFPLHYNSSDPLLYDRPEVLHLPLNFLLLLKIN